MRSSRKEIQELKESTLTRKGFDEDAVTLRWPTTFDGDNTQEDPFKKKLDVTISKSTPSEIETDEALMERVQLAMYTYIPGEGYTEAQQMDGPHFFSHNRWLGQFEKFLYQRESTRKEWFGTAETRAYIVEVTTKDSKDGSGPPVLRTVEDVIADSNFRLKPLKSPKFGPTDITSSNSEVASTAA